MKLSFLPLLFALGPVWAQNGTDTSTPPPSSTSTSTSLSSSSPPPSSTTTTTTSGSTSTSSSSPSSSSSTSSTCTPPSGKVPCPTSLPPPPGKTCIVAPTPTTCAMTYVACEACALVNKTSTYPCNCPTVTVTTCPPRRTCRGETVTTTWTANDGPTPCQPVQATCTCVVVLPPTGTGPAETSPPGSGPDTTPNGGNGGGASSFAALGALLGAGIGVAAFML